MDQRRRMERIARELSGDEPKPELWQQALKAAAGDRDKAKVLYIRARQEQIVASERAQEMASALQGDIEPDAGKSTSAGSGTASKPTHDDNAAPAVRTLRGELADLLAATGKGSFYSALGLSPTCGDGEIARAVTRLRALGDDRAAEIRYAIDALGDPNTRADYDRRLRDRLLAGPSDTVRTDRTSPAADSRSGGRRSRLYAGIAVAVAIVATATVFHQRGLQHAAEAHERQAIYELVNSRTARPEPAAPIETSSAPAHDRDRTVRIDEAMQASQPEDYLTRMLRQQKERDEYQARQRAERQAKAEARRDSLAARRATEAGRAAESRRMADSAMAARADRERRYWRCMNRTLDQADAAGAKASCDSLR